MGKAGTALCDGAMTRSLMTLLPLAAGAAGLLAGGALLSFSAFVMPALRTLPTPAAVRAMQAINDRAPRSALMLPLLGSAVLGTVTGVLAVAGRLPGDRALLVTGAGLAVAAFAVTAGYHVPRNDALGRVDAASTAGSSAWAGYAPGWTSLNHVRVALLLASGTCLVAGAAA